jgi:hypothetical protein
MNSTHDCENSKPDPERVAAVCFAQMLQEELHEIEQLRRKRQWVDGKDTSVAPPADTPRDPSAASDSAAKKDSSATPQPSSSPNPDPDCAVDAGKVFKQAHDLELVGVAFSGGGIRSATFNLGVLQGLAEHCLLPMCDYLSTVSGGGYIGSWLSAWIYRVGRDTKTKKSKTSDQADHNLSPIRSVQESLKPDRSEKPDNAEPRPIRFLREYSNYLTPRLGFLGADTWTAIAIYVRNLLLNQMILFSFLAAILLLPHIIGRATQAALISPCLSQAKSAAPAAIFILISVALIFVFLNMHNLLGTPHDHRVHFPWYSRQGWILALVVLPLFLAAWLSSVWLWQSNLHGHILEFAVGGAIFFSFAWVLASFANLPNIGPAAPHWSSTVAWVLNIIFSVISGAAGGALLSVFSTHILSKFPPHEFQYRPETWNVIALGTPLVVLIFMFVGALQIGLMGLYFPDPRREWWARLGGYLSITSLMWTAFFALAIYSPIALMWLSGEFKTREAVLIAWVASTLIGVLGGKSASTGSLNSHTWKDVALSITPYVFIVGLASAIALLLEACLAFMNDNGEYLRQFLAASHAAQKNGSWLMTGRMPVPAGYIPAHWQIIFTENLGWLILITLALLSTSLFLSWRFNINEFSMNLFYRNRLVRAYLGASHVDRSPNPFTGFDPNDELQMIDLRSEECYSGPFPIINSALNLVSGKNLAWQQRKAESFVFTPLRCGFDTWLEQIDLEDEDWATKKLQGIQKYGFRPTEHYGFKDVGLRLGTTVSISGAAASPNMGYHSSPSLAFLMTLFNVRLGFWAGNPRRDSAWQYPGPRVGLVCLLAELFGQTNDQARCVYLSDGGHFENLGIYELVKRRCKYIIACDADSDESYTFGDLGNAVRKCREDIGVEIDLATDELTPKSSSDGNHSSGESKSKDTNDKASKTQGDKFSKWHWAIGTIRYDLVDPEADPGILVYLKTSLTGDEESDVLAYRRDYPQFPHQTTADQWFTESQFESYRRLGQHVVEQLLKPIAGIAHRQSACKDNSHATVTKKVFETLQNHWQTKKEADVRSIEGLAAND